MRPFAIQGVAWSVCVSVCWLHSWVLQKRLNKLRCRLEDTLMWSPDPLRGRANFWRLSGPLTDIARHSSVVCSKKTNNGISATAAAYCTAPDWLVSQLTFRPWKILPVVMWSLIELSRPFVENSSQLCKVLQWTYGTVGVDAPPTTSCILNSLPLCTSSARCSYLCWDRCVH